jgi:hypothetical protein
VLPLFFTLLHPNVLLGLKRMTSYVCRPLNGKHKKNILCALCATAVNKILDPNDFYPNS